jgi:hypothetical protein
MVTHTCNPSIREVEAGDAEFKASLGDIAGPCLKKSFSTKSLQKFNEILCKVPSTMPGPVLTFSLLRPLRAL